ncbi:MAG TPA: YdcF family protein [Rhizobiaceae bacterium]|nr:YdcF family protein [Rhizobiaceae bacterium]
MFFVISKIGGFFLQPLNFVAFLFAIGIIALFLHRKRTALVFSSIAFVVLALAIWSDIGALLMQPLEERFQRPANLPQDIKGVILLGGAFEGGINRVRHGYELNAAGDRVIETLKLARLYPQAKILVTGGNGSLVRNEMPDADVAPKLFAAMGILADRLILEDKSRNTYQNAVFSKALADPKPGDNWVLVTSAFHMPRSVGIFRAAGFPVIPWPCDYRTLGNEKFGFSHDDPQGAVGTLSLAVHEWVGLLGYWMTGRTETLFPAPD